MPVGKKEELDTLSKLLDNLKDEELISHEEAWTWEDEAVKPYTNEIDGGAQRFNKGKLPMHLVPTSAIYSMARVMQYGSKKYAPRNWERGMDWSIPYSCLMRHILAWFDGEDTDPESGLSHLDHAMANIMMLVHYEQHFRSGDDRPKK